MKLKKIVINQFSNSGILIVALMTTNFLNFLFNAILGRSLNLEQFSILSLINTLWFLLSIFLNSLSSTTTNRTAYLATKRGEDIAEGFRNFIVSKSFKISLFIFTVWLILIPLFLSIFHTSNYFVFLSLSPAIIFGILIAVNRGYFQGKLSFSKAALIILSESISKLCLALFLVYFNLGNYAYVSIPLGVTIAFILTIILIRNVSKTNTSYSYTFPKKLLFATFLTTFSSIAFLSVDFLLARYFLSTRESGAYSLLSLIGKMVYFFGGLLNIFILTYASRDTGLNKNSANNFYKILTLNIGLLIIGFIGLGIFGKLLVPLFLGEKSRIILDFLIPYIFGISLFTVATAFATYHLAKQQFIFAYNGIFVTVLAILGIFIWHQDINNLVNVIIFVSFIYLSGNMIMHIFYKDISDYVDEEDIRKFADFEKIDTKPLYVSICIPAYNEEKNIGKLLKSLLNQKTRLIKINKIFVYSASDDKTNSIVKKIAIKNKKVLLIIERRRKGKAYSINSFLHTVTDSVVVIQSADTLPVEDTIEKLCRPFIVDDAIGMTGGAPIPINDRRTFIGYIIHSWWWFHRRIPRFGEIIAFRNIIKTIPENILCDEAYFQAKFSLLGYKRVHVDEAKIYNRGPDSIGELIEQRRKLFIGHAALHHQEGVRISNMTKSSIYLILFKYKIYSFKELIWLIGGIVIESYSRILGNYDTHIRKINPYIWDIAKSTKNISKKMRQGNQ